MAMNPVVISSTLSAAFARSKRRHIRPSGAASHNWEESGELYIVSEYIKGTTLRACVVPGGLSLDTFASLFIQLCRALSCAHDKGIVHRDVKPENVLITEQGRALLMDFGLAKGFQHSAITVSGTAVGTPAYMAPEQIMNKGLDHRSDQYSLGGVAFELLAGRPPFVQEDIIHLLMAHVNEEPPTLREIRPSIPPACEAMVMRMLAKSPQERYYDMHEVISAAEEVLADHLKVKGEAF
jgi:serine/threonine-protein kinase